MKIECDYDSDCPVKLEDSIVKNIADKTGVSMATVQRILEIGQAFLDNVFTDDIRVRIDKREKLKQDLKRIYSEKKSLQEIHEELDKANIKERLEDLGRY